MASTVNGLEDTLPDGAWKDSFDKLLDDKPVLRQLNILKDNVRVSFNKDSSVENSKDLSGLLKVPKVKIRKKNFSKISTLPKKHAPVAPFKCILEKNVRSYNNDSSIENSKDLSGLLKVPEVRIQRKIPTKISTPARKQPLHPFKCSISPIIDYKNRQNLLLRNNKQEKPTRKQRTTLQSTVINPDIVVIDYDAEKNQTKDEAECKSVTEFDLKTLLKTKKVKKRVVLFDSNVVRKSAPKSLDQLTEEKPKRRATSAKPRTLNKKRSNNVKNKRKSPMEITLQPGKWRKSLSHLRKSQNTQALLRRSSQRTDGCLEIIDDCDESVEFVKEIPISNFIGKRRTIQIKPEELNNIETNDGDIKDYKEQVFQYCNQIEPAPFHEMFTAEAMSNCVKIGEGVYGEVFLKKVEGVSIVCKIIPIEGTVLVNGETQKNFEQILPEIVISKELSSLKNNNADNATSGFVEIRKVSCVQGKYPDNLIKYWEEYDNEKDSENDHPGDLPESQLYIILDLEFAGQDMETFVFNNAEQSVAALKQIVLALAVAEESLEFEHRDLHWGNVLIRPIDESELTYKLSGKNLTLPSMGIKATIIDYTLSRIKYKNHYFYNDLTNDEELFTAKGDYQFDIYRMMRDLLGQNWERFEPKTNIYWISYIITKMLNGVKYKNTRSKEHTQILRKMRSLRNDILEYNSACEVVEHLLNL